MSSVGRELDYLATQLADAKNCYGQYEQLVDLCDACSTSSKIVAINADGSQIELPSEWYLKDMESRVNAEAVRFAAMVERLAYVVRDFNERVQHGIASQAAQIDEQPTLKPDGSVRRDAGLAVLSSSQDVGTVTLSPVSPTIPVDADEPSQPQPPARPEHVPPSTDIPTRVRKLVPK